MADDGVGDRASAEVDSIHLLVGVLDAFFDCGGNLVGLAVAPADVAPAVADDHQGVKAEPPAPLDHRGTAANGHDAFVPLASVSVAFTSFARH